MFFHAKKEKNILYLMKQKNEREKKTIHTMFEYAEGKLEISEVIDNFRSNTELIQDIFSNKEIPTHISEYYVSFIKTKIKKKSLSLLERLEFYDIISIFFKRLNIQGNYFNPENYYLNLIIEATPTWIYPDENYFIPIIEKQMPKEISKEEQLMWCKNKLQLLYQYDEYPPEWLQDAIWPIYNGRPMVFTKQIKKNNKTTYCFIDKESGVKKNLTQTT